MGPNDTAGPTIVFLSWPNGWEDARDGGKWHGFFKYTYIHVYIYIYTIWSILFTFNPCEPSELEFMPSEHDWITNVRL